MIHKTCQKRKDRDEELERESSAPQNDDGGQTRAVADGRDEHVNGLVEIRALRHRVLFGSRAGFR